MSKVALITGASRGIGAGIALEFAKNGVDIVLNYNSTEPNEVVEKIQAFGVKCLAVQADISKYDEAKSLINQAKEHFGRIDFLINNAGITRDGLVARMKEKDYDDVVNTNLKGAFNTIAHASPIMLKQKEGAIVNISSVAGVFGNAGQANYSAAKAGMIGLTKATARELGSRGITVNAIAPGFIETDMTNSLNDSVKEAILAQISLKRYGTVQEVAQLVYFIANAKYITGQVVNIDGGF